MPSSVSHARVIELATWLADCPSLLIASVSAAFFMGLHIISNLGWHPNATDEEDSDHYVALKTHPSRTISLDEYDQQAAKYTAQEVQRLLCSEEFQYFVSDPSPKIPNFPLTEKSERFRRRSIHFGWLLWGCCGVCTAILFFGIKRPGQAICSSVPSFQRGATKAAPKTPLQKLAAWEPWPRQPWAQAPLSLRLWPRPADLPSENEWLFEVRARLAEGANALCHLEDNSPSRTWPEGVTVAHGSTEGRPNGTAGSLMEWCLPPTSGPGSFTVCLSPGPDLPFVAAGTLTVFGPRSWDLLQLHEPLPVALQKFDLRVTGVGLPVDGSARLVIPKPGNHKCDESTDHDEENLLPTDLSSRRPSHRAPTASIWQGITVRAASIRTICYVLPDLQLRYRLPGSLVVAGPSHVEPTVVVMGKSSHVTIFGVAFASLNDMVLRASLFSVMPGMSQPWRCPNSNQFAPVALGNIVGMTESTATWRFDLPPQLEAALELNGPPGEERWYVANQTAMMPGSRSLLLCLGEGSEAIPIGPFIATREDIEAYSLRLVLFFGAVVLWRICTPFIGSFYEGEPFAPGERSCAVCWSHVADVALDCGHVCTCGPCSTKIPKCPLCRRNISRRLRVYW